MRTLDFDRPKVRAAANGLADVLARCDGKPERPGHDYSADPDLAVYWGSAQAAMTYMVQNQVFELLARERYRPMEPATGGDDDGA